MLHMQLLFPLTSVTKNAFLFFLFVYICLDLYMYVRI